MQHPPPCRPPDGQHALSTSLQSRHLTMMSIAGVIGAALFVGSGSVIAQAGPASVLAYLAGGALVILIMRMLGEMAIASPDTGSFSTYAERAIGRWAGFTIGWLYWWFWTLLMAWEAYVAGTILHDWLPLVSVPAYTAAVTALLVVVNFMQVRKYGEFEFWFALIKVVAIVVFLLLGTLAVLHLWPLGQSSGTSHLYADGGFMPNGVGSVAVALLGVMFAFLGAEIVTIAASEAQNPAEQIVRATNSVVWRICLFYIGSIFLIVCLVPWNDPLLGAPGYGAYRRMLELLGLPGIARWVMSFVVLTSVCSCFISAHYTCSRMLYSLSRRGDAPALLQQTRSNGTPIYAVIASCLMAVGIAALNFFDALRPHDILDMLMNTTGMIALLVYLVIAFSQLRMRRQLEREGREIRHRMWLFPWLTYAVIVFIIASLLAMLCVDAYRDLVLSTGLAALVIVVAGVVVHRRAARHNATGHPPANPRENPAASSLLPPGSQSIVAHSSTGDTP